MSARCIMVRSGSTPAMIGKIAKMIGTAPRSPTQEMSVDSFQLKWNGIRLTQTARGRAMNIRMKAADAPTQRLSRKKAGVASSPNNKNIVA